MNDNDKLFQRAVVDTLNQIRLASFLIAAAVLAIAWKLYVLR